MLEEFLHAPRIAYFSMEIALRSEIPTYAGGLGILAGDTLRTAADLRLPLVAVSLVSRAGYFRQQLDAEGAQSELPASWDPGQWAQRLDARIAVRVEGRPVWICAWAYVHECEMGGRAPVILLDTDLAENEPADREITHHLYGGDDALRMKQEMVLGMGGVRMLQALGFEISRYHMNEGHAALLGVELLKRHAYAPEDLHPGESPYDLPHVRQLCCFTTHTPVEAGQDRFSYELADRLLDHGGVESVTLATLKQLGGADCLNMTQLALNLSEFVNGVAKRHAETSSRMFPGHIVRAITNGVHPHTWTAPGFRRVYDHYLPGWRHEPQLLTRIDIVPDAALLEAHAQARRALIERVRLATGVVLNESVAILGFARRMTAYKRPDLLFSDLERLRRIASTSPFQIVLAGKAHPRDVEGKRLIRLLHQHMRELGAAVPTVFLPDYDMAMAQELVAGVDVWLNTPLPPLEASGTSGMKAAFNGVPSLSVADGWWLEGHIEGLTGWVIDDATSLYDKLENLVLPLFRAQAAGWLRVMRGAIGKNASCFNSLHMMRRYVTEAYLR